MSLVAPFLCIAQRVTGHRVNSNVIKTPPPSRPCKILKSRNTCVILNSIDYMADVEVLTACQARNGIMEEGGFLCPFRKCEEENGIIWLN
ncbi:hypothetical protein SAMN05421730_101616 [Anaerobium acetethylicum]|uniref:Uncharacterized protein n=1 Tax=Anaerobium acetethylicum TaxID=1619234 RepID=A0A1D3TV87_9FIRM|nr:hypothetical protein SAMN05421730_101616 [Anaerobium acetethylicum]